MRPTSLSAASTRASASSRGTPRVSRPKRTFVSTLIQGNSPLSWNTMAFSTAQPAASILMAPEVCLSRPARIRNSVDFPQPLGPTMQRNSPGATRRSTWSMATTLPCSLMYSRRRPAISTAAPRRCTGIKLLPSGPVSVPAARQLAVLVLEHERPELADGVVDIGGIDDALRRELLGRHLVLHVPLVDVEHAGDVDLAVRAARRPRIFFQELAARGGLGVDQFVDDLLAVRRPVIGLAIH